MTSVPRRFLFLLGSARTGGNTEMLARRAAEGLPARDQGQWIHLDELALPPIRDRRHDGDGTTPLAKGPERTAQDVTLAATDIVIASPLYWYSVSGTVKTYLDYWSGWLRVPGLDFRERMGGKRLWGVTAMATADPSVAAPLAGTLRLTAGFMGMEWRGVLLGNGSRPGHVLDDEEALLAAKTFFDLDANHPPAVLV